MSTSNGKVDSSTTLPLKGKKPVSNTPVPGHKKRKRNTKDDSPNVMLKRFIQAVQAKEKKNEPLTKEDIEKEEKTKARRRETNQKRRTLSKVLIRTLGDGDLYTKHGKAYENIWNVVAIPEDKKYLTIVNNNEIHRKKYTDGNQLAEVECDIKRERKGDKDFKELLKRYIAGDH